MRIKSCSNLSVHTMKFHESFKTNFISISNETEISEGCIPWISVKMSWNILFHTFF